MGPSMGVGLDLVEKDFASPSELGGGEEIVEMFCRDSYLW